MALNRVAEPYFNGNLFYSQSEVIWVSELLINGLNESHCFAFHGEIGAGKTTLIQSLLCCLGVKDNVISPTFTLEHQYDSSFGRIFHYDLYRIEDIVQIDELGIVEALINNYICLIEWPEIAYNILPTPFWQIRIEHLPTDNRLLHIHLVS